MRDKMARLTSAANGIIEQHEQKGERRQYAGSAAAKFLLVAVLQVCNGATGRNQRPWTFLKTNLRLEAAAFAHYNDQGNTYLLVI